MLEETKQRKIPLLIHACLLFILIKKSTLLYHYPELYYFFFGTLISTLLALFFTFFSLKASLHMVGMMGVSFFIIGLSLHFQIRLIIPICIWIIASGLVATSRLELKAHTSNELFLGTLLGAIPQIALLFLWL
jgi:hypothetical protein